MRRGNNDRHEPRAAVVVLVVAFRSSVVHGVGAEALVAESGLTRLLFCTIKARYAGPNQETNYQFLMLYFAYGSNMDEERVKAANRCPNARFIFNAMLPEHRLVFTHGGDAGTCAADAVPEPGSLVWGVVYDITDSDRRQLDAREGVAIRAYRPKELLVHPHGDKEQRIMALTYSAGDAEDMERPPSREYLDYLLRGARRWGLPADYIVQLERIQVFG